MEVYRIAEAGLYRIPQRDIEYERNLEEHLLLSDGAEIGGVELFYISRQDTPDEGGVFDILGLDANGDTVVVELKRGKAPRRVVAQALEYASGLRKESYADLDDRYQTFLRESGRALEDDVSLREAHAAFFAREEPLSEREFNTRQRIVVVGTEFRDLTLNMADLLREYNLDVVCVEYQAFESNEGELELLTTESVRRPLDQEPTGSDEDTLSETAEIQQEFWRAFKQYAQQRGFPHLATGTARSKAAYHPASGSWGELRFSANTRDNRLYCALRIIDENANFRGFGDRRNELTEDLYERYRELPDPTLNRATLETLAWEARENTKRDLITLDRPESFKIDNRAAWNDYHDWLLDVGELFHRVFVTKLDQ